MDEKEARKIYDSSRWRRQKRIEILERDNYECQDCKARLKEANEKGVKLSAVDRKIRRASEVHHIKELKDAPTLAFDDDNLISLCTQCHNIRHGRHPKRFVRSKPVVSEEKW